MSHPNRLTRLLLLTAGMTVLGAASGTLQGTAAAAPYKCVEITDGQGHVIDTICVPYPVG